MFLLMLLSVFAIVFGIWVGVGILMGASPLWFLSKDKIMLVHFDEEHTKSVILTNPDGSKSAYVYPMTKIGHVTLNEDGTTSNRSYIKKWYKI